MDCQECGEYSEGLDLCYNCHNGIDEFYHEEMENQND